MKLIGNILLALAAVGCLFCTFAVVAFHRAAVEHFHSTNQKLGQLEKGLEASKANCEALEKGLQRIEAEQAAAPPAAPAPEPAATPDLATKSFGYAPKAPVPQRQEAIARWRAWWDKEPKAPAP